MDSVAQNSSFSGASTPPQPSRKITLSMGMAISLVAIIPIVLIAVSFILLNYFNVVKIDTVFPALYFLPHQTRSGFAVDKTTNTKVYQYDIKGGQQTLRAYLGDMLLSSAMPSKNDAYMYASVVTQKWNIPSLGSTALATYSYMNNSEIRDALTVVFSVPLDQLPKPLTEEKAKAALQKVFKNLPNINQLTCKSIASGILCEEFMSNQDEKSGYGAAYSVPPSNVKAQPVFVLFSCKYYKSGLQFAEHTTGCMAGL